MTREVNDLNALWYDRLIEPLLAGIRRESITLCAPQSGSVVLDICCGTGTYLHLYRQRGCRVHGIDLAPSMIERARWRLGPDAVLTCGDASSLDYGDGCFDIVNFCMAIHEIPAATRTALAGEAVRVLKPGGTLMITDYAALPPRRVLSKVVNLGITFIEFTAGYSHFTSYREFLAKGGIAPYISHHPLTLTQMQTTAAGTIGLYRYRKVDESR